MSKIPLHINYDSETPWFFEDINHSSDLLIIAVSASSTIFEWKNFINAALKKLDLKQMYIADVDQAWYHGEYKGIDGYGEHAAAKFLQNKILEYGIKKVITIGASRGGYGSILFGTLLNADSVFAFNPKTYMTPGLNKKYSISHYLELLRQNLKDFSYDENNFDLKQIVLKNRIKTNYNIFYGCSSLVDTNQAHGLSDLSYIKYFPKKVHRHGISRFFIRDGIVQKMISDIV